MLFGLDGCDPLPGAPAGYQDWAHGSGYCLVAASCAVCAVQSVTSRSPSDIASGQKDVALLDEVLSVLRAVQQEVHAENGVRVDG